MQPGFQTQEVELKIHRSQGKAERAHQLSKIQTGENVWVMKPWATSSVQGCDRQGMYWPSGAIANETSSKF